MKSVICTSFDSAVMISRAPDILWHGWLRASRSSAAIRYCSLFFGGAWFEAREAELAASQQSG